MRPAANSERFALVWPIGTRPVLCYTKINEGGEGAMSPLEKKRIAAVKTADAINAIVGAPISSYARSLSASWARGELTGEQMKQALLAHHRRIAEQERQSRV